MSHHSAESAHDEHGGVHLPDPSIWPIVAGFGALCLGVALVWWSHKGTDGFTGPFLGVAFTLTLLAGFGWAYQDGVMKRKVEAGIHGDPMPTRFTQVLAFALAEGQLSAAQEKGGVLHAIAASDDALHDLAGFQDLRIIATPGGAGPAQVLVETTWAAREGLATYEESRRTILDLVNSHAGQVLPGSVQVFDMDVVRDTKDVSVKFGMGAAIALLGSLMVGGLMVGAGLNLFASDETAAEGFAPSDGGGGAVDTGAVKATDNKFDKATLEAPPNTDVTFTLTNVGRTKHNIHFFDKENGTTLAPGAEGKLIDGGQTDKVSFKTPAAGSYFFHCDLHPTEMKGTLVVKDGAPVPGQAASAGGGAAGDNAIGATDNKFDKASLTAAAGKEFVVTFNNKGKTKHNLHFLDKAGGKTLAPGAEGAIIDGGKSETLKFTPASAGEYFYQCDLHPTEMTGKLSVK